MGLLAKKIDREKPMEERMARLEAHVEHLQSDLSEVKIDIRRLDVKVDGIKESIASAKLWAFALYLTLAGGLLAVFARGMGWL